MWSSDVSSRASRTPSAPATASAVTSSVVGPRPPVQTTTREAPREPLEGLDDPRPVVVDDGLLGDLEPDRR